GCGNDYVYVDGFAHHVPDPAALARQVADRRFGIGSDGLILALPSSTADFRMRMWNADGSESEMCGNGIRCVSKFAYDRGLVGRRTRLSVETGAGPKAVELVLEAGEVVAATVDMGPPILERARIPMQGPAGQVVDEPLAVDGTTLRITGVSMGNPHAVTYVERVEAAPVTTLGPRVEHHPAFPRRTNVEFVEVLSRSEVRQRTWERGSGETHACGTGACAVTVAGVLTGRTGRELTLHLLGCDLHVRWPEGGSVAMTGPCVEVFEGSWPLGRA
ncbi:MAG: diaminopimelate epimerase, partial [Planctomycetia bacterium]